MFTDQSGTRTLVCGVVLGSCVRVLCSVAGEVSRLLVCFSNLEKLEKKVSYTTSVWSDKFWLAVSCLHGPSKEGAGVTAGGRAETGTIGPLAVSGPSLPCSPGSLGSCGPPFSGV